MIYLDHAASTPILPGALSKLKEASEFLFANPSSKHSLGHTQLSKIEDVRRIILEHFGAENKFELIFTSGATESNNLFIQSVHDCQAGVYFSGDHASVSMPMIHTFKVLKDCELPNYFNGNHFLEMKTLFAISFVNGQSGEVLDLEKIKNIKAHNGQNMVFLDCSQGLTKVAELFGLLKKYHQSIDGISISAHKMGGPKGIGALLFKKNLKIKPLYFGGGQEKGIRPGTLATPLILAWGEAFKLREKDLLNVEKVKSLHKHLYDSLKIKFGEKIIFPFKDLRSSYFITTVILPHIPSDILIRHLEEREIYISSSSACSSKIEGKNPVFKALGISEALHKNVLRVSINYETTILDLDTFVKELGDIYSNLMSLFGPLK